MSHKKGNKTSLADRGAAFNSSDDEDAISLSYQPRGEVSGWNCSRYQPPRCGPQFHLPSGTGTIVNHCTTMPVSEGHALRERKSKFSFRFLVAGGRFGFRFGCGRSAERQHRLRLGLLPIKRFQPELPEGIPSFAELSFGRAG